MRYFDYKTEAREAGLTAAQLRRLSKLVRAEFPTDDMMYELHLLGACLAVREGRASPDELLLAADRPSRRKSRADRLPKPGVPGAGPQKAHSGAR